MNITELGNQLKQRIIERGDYPAKYIEPVSPEAAVTSYEECAFCGRRFAGRYVALDSEDIEEFLAAINRLFERHKENCTQARDRSEP
jgi:broad-specificity NMP kinase